MQRERVLVASHCLYGVAGQWPRLLITLSPWLVFHSVLLAGCIILIKSSEQIPSLSVAFPTGLELITIRSGPSLRRDTFNHH
jgi:hypothetical protein